jgi:hypothetical protein
LWWRRRRMRRRGMFIGKLSVLQVHIVVGSEYSWAIMTNLGHITGSL